MTPVAEFAIIDAHTHPMVDGRQRMLAQPHAPADYLGRAAPVGIERAAALVMAPRADLELTQALNDAVINVAEESNGFFFPVCSARL